MLILTSVSSAPRTDHFIFFSALMCVPQLIQFQSCRGRGGLYFKGHHGLLNGCITKLLYLTF